MKAASLIRRLYLRSGLRSLLPHPVKVALRRQVWLRLARAIGYPISSPQLPRPPLPRNRRPMRLSHVVLACDLNPDYLEFWPPVRRAWTEIVGIEPLLVLVAPPDQVPADLRDDDAVIQFVPVEGVHTALQAQCIRLLYPALIETRDAVLISDLDNFPLRPAYFHAPVARLDERAFVSYRDVLHARGEVAIGYNAAAAATWAEIFDVASVDDVTARIGEWAARGGYDGRRGWDGWYRDQEVLAEKLNAWPRALERWWTLDDDYCGFNRLDRLDLIREDGLEPHRRKGLLAMEYSDGQGLVPYREHRELNELILELGLEAARMQSSRRRHLRLVG